MVSIVDGGNAFSTFAETLDGGNAFTVYGPDVEIVVGAAGPTVSVGFAALTEGAVALTVHAVTRGKTAGPWTEPFAVRCERQSSARTSWEDAEVPIGVVREYLAEMFDADGGSLGVQKHQRFVTRSSTARRRTSRTRSTRRQLSVCGDADGCGSTDTVDEGTRTAYSVGFRTVVLAGIRGLRTDMNMDFLTDTVEERERIYALMEDTGGIVLIRTPAPATFPPAVLLGLRPAATSHWTDGDDVLTTWANSVDEVTTIVGDVAVPRVTWQVYMDAFPHVDRHAGRIYDLVRRDAEPTGRCLMVLLIDEACALALTQSRSGAQVIATAFYGSTRQSPPRSTRISIRCQSRPTAP